MNVSLLWLKELVPTDLGVAEVAEALTRVGLNVNNITDLGGGDACLLVEVTSNRPDCLGHIGVARELAAALGVPMKMPDATVQESADAVDQLTRVEVVEPDLCPLYTARVIRGVKIGPSPAWMARRLEAVGIRPVNNIVNVTNYVMMECGQPLHAFDYARLGEHRIVVRRAAAGERFVAIDHSEHTLSPDRLVIADARRAVALAGVMGGVDTEIADGTHGRAAGGRRLRPACIRGTARDPGHVQRIQLPLRAARRPAAAPTGPAAGPAVSSPRWPAAGWPAAWPWPANPCRRRRRTDPPHPAHQGPAGHGDSRQDGRRHPARGWSARSWRRPPSGSA